MSYIQLANVLHIQCKMLTVLFLAYSSNCNALLDAVQTSVKRLEKNDMINNELLAEQFPKRHSRRDYYPPVLKQQN